MLERRTLENPRTFLSIGLADHQDKLHFQRETLSQNHKVEGHRGTQYYPVPPCVHTCAYTLLRYAPRYTTHTKKKINKSEMKNKKNAFPLPSSFIFDANVVQVIYTLC